MRLKPGTREFLLAAGSVALVFIGAVGWFIWRFYRGGGVDGAVPIQGLLINGAFFALVLVLGIGAPGSVWSATAGPAAIASRP